MKRIVFINSLSNGGAERVVSRLYNDEEFSEKTLLLTLSKLEFYQNNVKYKKSFDSKISFFSYVKAMFYLLKLNCNDVVQAHLNFPILISGLAKILGGRFSFQAVHCFSYSSFYMNKSTFFRLVHKFLMLKVLKEVSVHVFKSTEMVSDFESTFGWKPKKTVIIHNPLDLDNIRKLSNELVETSDFDKQKTNIAIVGRLNKSKRPLDIISLAEKFQDVAIFHFFGDGPEKSKLESLVDGHRLNNVIFHGVVDNPFKFTRQFGVYLSCSESEGFPNALVEAMVCEAIPIHSDCLTGPKEILCENLDFYSPKKGEFSMESRGILFPVGDMEALSKAIYFVHNNSQDIKINIIHANAEYTESLSIDKIILKYKNTLFGF